MPRKRTVEDLTEDDLRALLMEKRRVARQSRIESFRRSGRVIQLEPQAAVAAASAELEDEREPEYRPLTRRRKTMDQLLVVVEVGAVLGLFFIIFNGFQLLQNLNQEVSSALVQPTLTPTPVISAVVLPSGHTPPDSPGGVQPNDAEIPEHLRPLVQSIANLPVPTPSAEQAVRIQIEALNVDAPVVQGDGWEQLKKGVGQHIGTGIPGKAGNLILSAHNDVFGQIFRDLDQLKAGDEIVLLTSQRSYVYVVQQTQYVEPTAVEVMAASQDPIVTLISCYPYMVDNQRIVVTAALQGQR